MFSADDHRALTDTVVAAWASGADRDWSALAGTLDWSCARTAVHAVDTVIAPALFLASRSQSDYPPFEPLTMGSNPDPQAFVEGLNTATRVLLAVVAAAEPDARAVIWRRPSVEVRGPEDFVSRAGLELIVHAHDMCTGLRVPFLPDHDVVDRLRRHVARWPMWNSPGWRPLTMTNDPWEDLLHSTGRGSPVRVG